MPGFNDLATVQPEIAKEWSPKNNPWTPDQAPAGANRMAWWRCEKGHEWQTLISTRVTGSKCPYCSGVKLLTGFNDLKTRFPELAAEWSPKNLPLCPEQINEKSRLNVWWKCKTCGYEWQSIVSIQFRTKSTGMNMIPCLLMLMIIARLASPMACRAFVRI